MLEVLNLDPNRKLDYKTFAGQGFALEQNNATLRDNFGNHYRSIEFGFSDHSRFAVTRLLAMAK